MIPASILLFFLIVAVVVFILWAVTVVRNAEQRMQARFDQAMAKQAEAIVTITDYKRDQSDLQYEFRRIRSWSKMPDDFKF